MPNQVTRRDFLGAGALGVLAALSACGAPQGKPDIVRASGPSAIKRHVVFGERRPKTVDMQRTTDRVAAFIATSVFDRLLRVDENNALQPVLLSAVPRFEPDGVTLPCELEAGITFHDGTPLTSADVAYTFARMFRHGAPSVWADLYQGIRGARAMLAGETDTLEGLVVIDDLHFAFVLEEPRPTFCRLLALSLANIYPAALCEAAGEAWGDPATAVGTGRYRIKAAEESQLVLEVNNAYHGDTPWLDELTFAFFDDPYEKVEAFRAGAIDYCRLNFQYRELAELLADPELEPYVSAYETTGLRYIGFNLNHEFLSNVRLREALSCATDRVTIGSKVMGGAGVAATGCLGIETPGYDAQRGPYVYDFDYAKKLIAETNTLGLGLECHCLPGDDERFMLVIQDYWKEIGVDLHVTAVDEATLAAELERGEVQVTCFEWSPPFPEGESLLRDCYRSDRAALRSSFYHNSEYDALVDAAAAAPEGLEREELWRAADQLISREDYAILPIYWPKGFLLARDYVVNAGVSNMVFDMSFVGVDVDDKNYPYRTAG